MLVEKKDTYTIISPEKTSFKDFFLSFTKNTEHIQKEHLVINFSENFNTSLQEILLFLNIAIDYRNNGTSFVIIYSGINIDDIPDEINIVPTFSEALDILEMDAIERDLMNF